MVQIVEKNNQFVFNIKGLHQFWALHDKITVAKTDVVSAYQDQDEVNQYAGFRLGTHIPFLITAGTYWRKDKRNFWDVMRKKNTIIVELQNSVFDKLYIEVENPQTALALLNSKSL